MVVERMIGYDVRGRRIKGPSSLERVFPLEENRDGLWNQGSYHHGSHWSLRWALCRTLLLLDVSCKFHGFEELLHLLVDSLNFVSNGLRSTNNVFLAEHLDNSDGLPLSFLRFSRALHASLLP